MTADTVRTVTGDVPADTLGVVNSHDHLFLTTPALPGDELQGYGDARRELLDFGTAGGKTVIQWTPRGLRRGLPGLRTLSQTTDTLIVAATGRHRCELYGPENPVANARAEELAGMFIDDVHEQRCGLIKVGTGYRGMNAFERESVQAAAVAHHATGAPVAVHLERGTAGHDVLEAFRAEGIAPDSLILGHIGRNPDPFYVVDLAQSGAFLALDGPSAENHLTDWRLMPLIQELAAAGHLAQLLLGADTTNAHAQGVFGGPGMSGLLRRTRNDIERHLGPEVANSIFVSAPRLAWRQRSAKIEQYRGRESAGTSAELVDLSGADPRRRDYGSRSRATSANSAPTAGPLT
jgi:5-phospho-D-xylono-1,4-lactonase